MSLIFSGIDVIKSYYKNKLYLGKYISKRILKKEIPSVLLPIAIGDRGLTNDTKFRQYKTLVI